jgi:RNA polymerase sigma-70 factor (ECF subfamily)
MVFCIYYCKGVTELVAETNNQSTMSEFASRICSGDIVAYEQFVRSQWATAVRTCWFVLRNIDDAEEAAQDAFVSLYKARGQLKNPSKFRVWFYRVLINSARQKWRNRSRILTEPAQDISDPEDQIEQADTKITVRGALRNLSQTERMVLVLCYFCGLTDREGSFAAGWSLGTYKWRLVTARRHLFRQLQEKNYLASDITL